MPNSGKIRAPGSGKGVPRAPGPKAEDVKEEKSFAPPAPPRRTSPAEKPENVEGDIITDDELQRLSDAESTIQELDQRLATGLEEAQERLNSAIEYFGESVEILRGKLANVDNLPFGQVKSTFEAAARLTKLVTDFSQTLEGVNGFHDETPEDNNE